MEASACVKASAMSPVRSASALFMTSVSDRRITADSLCKSRNFFPHIRARPIYNPSKSLSASHQKVIELRSLCLGLVRAFDALQLFMVLRCSSPPYAILTGFFLFRLHYSGGKESQNPRDSSTARCVVFKEPVSFRTWRKGFIKPTYSLLNVFGRSTARFFQASFKL